MSVTIGKISCGQQLVDLHVGLFEQPT